MLALVKVGLVENLDHRLAHLDVHWSVIVDRSHVHLYPRRTDRR